MQPKSAASLKRSYSRLLPSGFHLNQKESANKT